MSLSVVSYSGRRLPAELCDIILEEAICIPKFFDVDPMETYGPWKHLQYFDRGAYWASERLRNNLRRVCKSWNSFLQRFSHRFIDTVDVTHGDVPIDALPFALRIYVSECGCPANSGPKRLAMRLSHRRNYDTTFKTLYSAERGVPVPWKLRIIEFSPFVAEIGKFLLERHRVYNLQSVIGAPDYLMAYIYSLGIQPTVIWRLAYRGLISMLTGTFVSQLTTLKFSLNAGHPLPTNPPALRYLHVVLSIFSDARDLVSLLKGIGKQLRALYCAGETQGWQLSPTIWELCPSIEILQMSPSVRWESIPRGHPIHTLQIGSEFNGNGSKRRCPECGLVHRVLLNLNASIEECAASGIRTLACYSPWTSLHVSMITGMGANGNLVCLASQARRHGISFVDCNWLSFDEYAVSQLEIGQWRSYI